VITIKRIISLDNDVHKALIEHRAKKMLESASEYPFNKALNDLLRKALDLKKGEE